MSLPIKYYNASIENFASTNSASIPLRFNEQRAVPIISDVSKYEMAVIRFTLDSYSLPSFIASIVPSPNADPNKMIQSVNLQYIKAGVVTHSGETNLTFVPNNKHIPVPPAPSPLQKSSEYYWLNSYTAVADLINTAMSTATTNLKALNPVDLADLVSPKIIYDPASSCFSVLAQSAFFETSLANRVTLFFNRPLYGMLSTLPATKNFDGLNGRIYAVDFTDPYGTRSLMLTAGGSTQSFIQSTQEFSTIGNLNPVASVGFTSPTLPVIYTELSEPLTYLNGQLISNGTAALKNTVICDFVLDERAKPNITYIPAEYRMQSFTGNGALQNIELVGYWTDPQGYSYPFELQSGASCSIQLMFRPKSM